MLTGFSWANFPTRCGRFARTVWGQGEWEKVCLHIAGRFQALALFWYFHSPEVNDRPCDTQPGQDILTRSGTDLDLAAAFLLGVDVAATIESVRQGELLRRWPGDVALLIRELTVRGGPLWPRDPQRRGPILDALTRGLNEGPMVSVARPQTRPRNGVRQTVRCV